MTAGWIIARSEWRLRWRALLAIALIGWLASSVAIAAFAASRRAESAFDRLLEATGASNLEGFFEGPIDGEEFEALAGIDGVEGGDAASMFIVGPADGDLVAGGNVIGAALRHSFGNSMGALMIEGRAIDQTKVDEVMVNEAFREVTGIGAGDRMDLVSYTPEESEQAEMTGEIPEVPGGPTVPVLVTGVGRGAEDVSDVADPIIIVSAAFADRYQDEIGNLSTIVLLRVDPDRFEEVAAAAAEVIPGLELQQAEDLGARIRDGLGVQRVALLVFAGAAAAAGLLALAQNLRRFIGLGSSQRGALVAIGSSRRLELISVAVSLLPAALFVGVASALTSVVIAPSLVTGLAEQAEPDPGIFFDGTALVVGALVAGGALVVLALVLLRVGTRAQTAVPSASLADGVARSVRLGAGPATGVRFALDAGRAVGGVPTRSAILGAAVGVAGVVATLTFSASIAGLFERPADWGATFDAVVEAPAERDLALELAREIATVDGVAAVAVNDYISTDEGSTSLIAGDRSVATEVEALRQVKGTIPFSITGGRSPIRQDEMVVGKRLLDELGIGIGAKVVLETVDTRVDRVIVGTVVVPGIDELDRSVYLTPDGLADAGGEPQSAIVLVKAATGVEPDELIRRLSESHPDTRPVEAPSSIDNLDELGSLPSMLVGFLAVLSVVAGLSAMVLTVRRRRREIAVLRSLGFVRGQVAAAVAAQAATQAIVGLVIGIPVGVVAGRTIYGLVGSRVGFLVHPTLPAMSIAAVVGVALGCAVLGAVVVAPGAQRLAPAATLRAE